jgi:hypothetical protein
MLSVEAVQLTWIELEDCAVALTLVGTLGGWVSLDGGVVAVAGGDDCPESFHAES